MNQEFEADEGRGGGKDGQQRLKPHAALRVII
jgi:hypothetical protein